MKLLTLKRDWGIICCVIFGRGDVFGVPECILNTVYILKNAELEKKTY